MESVRVSRCVVSRSFYSTVRLKSVGYVFSTNFSPIKVSRSCLIHYFTVRYCRYYVIMSVIMSVVPMSFFLMSLCLSVGLYVIKLSFVFIF